MKRVIVLVFCLFVALLPSLPQKEAHADSSEVYAVAPTQEVWFYSEAEESRGLFILPQSYYVRVLSDGDPFCRVEYLDNADGFTRLTGYCKRSDLLFVDFIPARPYLHYGLELTYTIDNGTHIGSGGLSSITRTVSFYGTYKNGTALYYYVYADGVFDYVLATQEVNYELNTDYLAAASGEVPPDGQNPEEGLTGIQIAVICIVCAATVAVAFFVLRGKKPRLTSTDQPEF